MSSIMDLVKKKKQALQAQSGRREKTHKPQPGKSRFRILPGWRGKEDPMFYMDFSQHFVKDTKNDLKAVYVCTDKTFGKPCPVCDSIEQGIRETSDDDILNALKDSKSKGRILFNALHLDGEDPSSPIILDLTPTTAEKVFDLMEEYDDITDLKEGTDIVINRSGKGLNTEYSVLPSPKSKPVDAAVMKNLHNLDEYVKQEYDEGRNKAIAAVSGVSGVLPSGGAPAIGSDADRPITSVPASESAAAVLDGVAEEEFEPEEPATEAAAEDSMSDDELDAMLADLS